MHSWLHFFSQGPLFQYKPDPYSKIQWLADALGKKFWSAQVLSPILKKISYNHFGAPLPYTPKDSPTPSWCADNPMPDLGPESPFTGWAD